MAKRQRAHAHSIDSTAPNPSGFPGIAPPCAEPAICAGSAPKCVCIPGFGRPPIQPVPPLPRPVARVRIPRQNGAVFSCRYKEETSPLLLYLKSKIASIEFPNLSHYYTEYPACRARGEKRPFKAPHWQRFFPNFRFLWRKKQRFRAIAAADIDEKEAVGPASRRPGAPARPFPGAWVSRTGGTITAPPR